MTVWRLIQKYAFAFIGYLFIVLCFTFPFYNHDRLTGPDPLDLSFQYYQIFGLFWVIIAAIWLHEQIEDKSNGYRFLRQLPIKPEKIVRAKFVVMLFTVGIYVAFYSFAFWMISSSPDYVNPGVRMMICAGTLTLLIGGMIYVFIFRFGFTKLRIVLFVLMMLSIALPIILNALIFPKLGIDKVEVIGFLSGKHWIWVASLGLVLYIGLMRLSGRQLNKAKI